MQKWQIRRSKTPKAKRKDISLSYIDIDTKTDEPTTIDKQQQIQTITTIPKTNTFCNAYIETPIERETQYAYNAKEQKIQNTTLYITLLKNIDILPKETTQISSKINTLPIHIAKIQNLNTGIEDIKITKTLLSKTKK